MNATELRKVEARHQRAFRAYEQAREARNTAVHDALEAGMSQRDVAEATGLTVSRVSQLASVGFERVVTVTRRVAS